MYSVMQSDWNIFCGVVVLDGVYLAYRDGDNILNKKYEKLIYKNYRMIAENAYCTALHNREIIKFSRSPALMYALSCIVM